MEIMLDSLVRTYRTSAGTDVRAVENISLTIPSDTIYGIVGKSGAGKSKKEMSIHLRSGHW